ncbi:MAG: hemolysin family protein [Pseudomonadota bacterium]
MALLILYIALAIGVSFVCSILEAVFLSITPSFTASLEQKDPALAKKVRSLKANVDKPLAAILSLNTVAHTVGAAGAGAQAAVVFGDAALGVFSAVLTFAILVLSEIIPKTIGAMYWRGLTPLVARTLPVLMVSMWPLVKLSQGITAILSGGKKGHKISRDEISALADVGVRAGVVADSESRIVRNLLRFDSLKVKDIMTPRTVLFALPQSMALGAVLDAHQQLPFSRIPIYDETVDSVTGFVLKSDVLLGALREQGDAPLSDIRQELLSVPETMPLQTLFQELLENDRHIALVVDEFGGTAGVVSLEDVVETLLGMEIVDETDTVEDLQALARQSWQDRARRIGLISEDKVEG